MLSVDQSAFVSLLYYHCQLRRQTLDAAQSQYLSATVIGGANSQLSNSKGGFWAKVFPSKSVAWWGEVWPGGGKCGTVGKSVVDSLPGEEEGKQGQQA